MCTLHLPIRYGGYTNLSADTVSKAVMNSRLPSCLIRGFFFPHRVTTLVCGDIPITNPFSSTLVIALSENR